MFGGFFVSLGLRGSGIVRLQTNSREVLVVLNGLFDSAVVGLSPVGTGQIAKGWTSTSCGLLTIQW